MRGDAGRTERELASLPTPSHPTQQIDDRRQRPKDLGHVHLDLGVAPIDSKAFSES